MADLTRWLHPGDTLDSEARRRSRTLYLPWGYVPMFSRELARGPFSLLAGGGQQVRVHVCGGGEGSRPQVSPLPPLHLAGV